MELLFGAMIVLGGGAAFLILRPKAQTGWQQKAGMTLARYAERLRDAAERIGQPHSGTFWDMSESVERIRREVMDDARDLAMTRRFVQYHARVIVELAEKFVALNDKARPEHQGRLDDLGAQLRGYAELFARVEKACIDNDFEDMEATMAALDAQLERLPF